MTDSLSRGLILVATLALAGTFAFAAESKPKTKVLIDFTKQDVEMEAGSPKQIKKYDYSFGTWDNKLVFHDGKGLLIPALSGRGGIGTEGRLAISATATEGVIEFVVGNRNESRSFAVTMVDGDGTHASWYISIKDKSRGVPIPVSLDLTKPDKEEKPGKKPGFEKTKVKSWEIKGDWQDAKLEVLLVRLSVVAP